jgi:hypothetical protein
VIVTLGQTDNFTYEYQTVNSQTNQPFRDTLRRAQGLQQTCENDFAQLQSWFAGVIQTGFGPGNRITLLVDLASLARNNGFHPDGSSLVTINPFDGYANESLADDAVRALFVAEIIEVLMDRYAHSAIGHDTWHEGWSDGEGLSRVAAALLYPAPYYTPDLLNGPFINGWLQSGRNDQFISTPDRTDQNSLSFGCSSLFIYYMHSQLGFPMVNIVSNGQASLEVTYETITGRSGGEAAMSALLSAYFPIGSTPSLPFDNVFPLTGPEIPISSRSVVARTPWHLDVFWVGQDSQIWTQFWDQAPGQNWINHLPFPIARSLAVSASTNSGVAAVARLPGHLDVFWVGQDGNIWSQWWDQGAGDNWSDHQPFRITTIIFRPSLAIAAVARTRGHLDVFWVGQDNQIWTQWWDQAPGQNWTDHLAFVIATSFPVPVMAESSIAAVARLPGHLDVFWMGNDSQIWTQWWDQAAGSGWDNHQPFPINPPNTPSAAGSPIAAVSRTSGHLDIFWVDQDGYVWSQWWDEAPGAGWGDHSPFQIGPFSLTGPPAFAARSNLSSLAAVARLPGHLDVFWVGADGQIWTQWWDEAPGQSWSNHDPFPISNAFPASSTAKTNSPIAAVARLPGHLDVFWVGTDGQVWTQWWDQSPGMGWSDHGPFPIAVAFRVPAQSW